jgi:hypothetical protein
VCVCLKLKVHGTLLQTGLLAASGCFAGVEEHAPESWVMRDEAEGPWYSHKQCYLLQAVVLLVWRKVPDRSLLGTGGNLESIVLSRESSSVANVGLARAEESARQLLEGN